MLIRYQSLSVLPLHNNVLIDMITHHSLTFIMAACIRRHHTLVSHKQHQLNFNYNWPLLILFVMQTFRLRWCSHADALPEIIITQMSRWQIVNQSCYPSVIDYITGVVFNTRIIALRYKQMFWYYKPHVIKNNATIRLSGGCTSVYRSPGSRSSVASSEFMPYLVFPPKVKYILCGAFVILTKPWNKKKKKTKKQKKNQQVKETCVCRNGTFRAVWILMKVEAVISGYHCPLLTYHDGTFRH